MPRETSPLSAQQITALSADFNALGNLARGILNDPAITLTPGQSSSISADLTSLSNTAGSLATWAAQVAFEDSESAFGVLKDATSSANATVQRIKATAAKISAVVTIFGDAVSLGCSFGTGNAAAILGAAAKLKNSIASA